MKQFLNILPIYFCCVVYAANAQLNDVKQVQLTHFELQSTYIVKEKGEELSLANHASKNRWYPVTVPSTVLTGLVKNHVYPSPYIGLNNMFIPDANDSFNLRYHLDKYSFIPNVPNPFNKAYWYRTKFIVPANDKGKMFQLIFKGINYRAEVWLNGMLIADSSKMVGMFAEYQLSANKAIKVGKENMLAVKIYPLDDPGLPDSAQLTGLGSFYLNGGPTGDIGKNVTMLCSIGWDWMPEIHDRNMGIWQPVFLRTTGVVTIEKPQIITTLPKLPDTTTATIGIKFTITNNSATPQEGDIKIMIKDASISNPAITIVKNIQLQGNEQKLIALSAADYKELTFQHPHLWWPMGYGNPNLYSMQIQFVNHRIVSEEQKILFGIRTTHSTYTPVNGWGKREFYVNGKRIHLVGGAWVPDMMLQEDSLRFEQELQLCKNANANLIRIWGGGVTPPDAFWDACDRMGLLVWNDFWITGDTNGEFKGSADFPNQGNVFINNAISTIYRLRNHPSLLVWTGGNEGHARKELYDAMRNNIATLDGTRPFIPSSSGYAKLPIGWEGSFPDGETGGVYSGGSYKWEDASYYFKKINEGKDWVFKDETGLPSQPPIETLSKIIPDLSHDTSLPYPFNHSWGYHDACGVYKPYEEEMVRRYGTATNLSDFSFKMQLMNADGYRAIFEAAANKLNSNGGVLLWKLNPAFPSVIWQIFDWYLAPNAGYYFMQQACKPIHIQFNADDSSISTINKTYHQCNKLVASIAVYDLQGKLLLQEKHKLNISESAVQKISSLTKVLSSYSKLCFIDLNLTDSSGKNLSHNVYWLGKDQQYQDLKKLKPVKLAIRMIGKDVSKTSTAFTIAFTNKTHEMAFFLHPKITADKNEIFPGFWSNNYFSLAPGEKILVTATYPNASLANKRLQLQMNGWNRNNELITNIQ